MSYQELTKQNIRLQKELIKQFTSALCCLPEGRLTCKKIRGKVYYYRVENKSKKQIYISTGNGKLIYQLKNRRVMEASIAVMKKNIEAQKKMLKLYENFDPASIEKKLAPVYSNASIVCSYQIEAGFRRSQNKFYQQGLTERTSFGLYVRSKSEALIAELLHAANIPFQYEAPLQLSDKNGKTITYYPDFTIITPSGNIVYWEHAGRLDLPSYRGKFFSKLTDYYHHGIIVPDNLIITMNGPDGSINVEAISRIIDSQLLPFF